MCLPLSLGTFYNIELNPAFILSPFIAYAMWCSRDDRVTRAFVAAGICGLVSICAVNLMVPGNLKGNIAELFVWTLFAPSFLFRDRFVPIKQAVYWTAILSAIFLIAVTVPLVVTGDPVRGIYAVATNGHGSGTSYINVTFFGLPVYATFGVNSITPLFCLQAALICGGIYTARPPIAALLSTGLLCAAILVVESDSRTGQATLILLAIAVAGYAIWNRDLRQRSILVIAASVLALPVIASRDMYEGRLVAALYDTVGLMKADERVSSGGSGAPPNFTARTTPAERKTVEVVTTGRTSLWRAAVNDLAHSPVFGNGFAGFGRFFPVPNAEGNKTAHFYYLTLFWKGGVIFAVPFLAFIFLAFWGAWKSRDNSPEWYFTATGVALMFLLPSFSWDILIVPSAGALTWFLLGAMGRRETHA